MQAADQLDHANVQSDVSHRATFSRLAVGVVLRAERKCGAVWRGSAESERLVAGEMQALTQKEHVWIAVSTDRLRHSSVRY